MVVAPTGAVTRRARCIIIRKLIANLFCFAIPGVALMLVILFTVSPRALSVSAAWLDGLRRTDASIDACELIRDGFKAMHVIRCKAHFGHDGQPLSAVVDVWSSSSPFVTPASLHREFQYQRALTSREIGFSPDYPGHARAMDRRMLAAPGLGVFVILLLGVVFGLALRASWRNPMQRREDYVLDRTTDELVPINDLPARRSRRQCLLWSGALMFAMLACVYGLSYRLQASLPLLAFSELASQPAQLTGCESRRYGGRKGHDQIDCRFRYAFNGLTFTGQAESSDFRFFPTRARLDERVAQLEGAPTTARVDPEHPSFAVALTDTRWIVPQAFGLFELMLLVLLAGVLPVALGVVMWRWRGERRDASSPSSSMQKD